MKRSADSPAPLTQDRGTGSPTASPIGCCTCSIVPKHVLQRFATDKSLSPAERRNFANAVKLENTWRRARTASSKVAALSRSIIAVPPAAGAAAAAAPAPAVLVFDCQHGTSLPGLPVTSPGSSKDSSAKQAFVVTSDVASFFATVFGRNSLDNAGLSLVSSVHYGINYNNAAWVGSQMKYGDGDGNIFIDFTGSNDVIAHELTHGVTQFTAGFAYVNESGGLNESMSDVFGSMFRQWQAKQDVTKADWLIGKEILGPGALARGYTCLRDLSNPAAAHCLAPQPTNFSQYTPGMDPHDSSGIPNFAFYKAAMAIGGNSWDKAGRIWYAALTGYAPSPNMKMKTFADRTRAEAKKLFPTAGAIYTAVDNAWRRVGL